VSRIEFIKSLGEIQEDVLILGSMVAKAIDQSIKAHEIQNASLAQQVLAGDEAINQKRWEIEENTLTLIARQAPMAGDLRRIMASVHIATNLERMGDHAEGIARLTLLTADEPLLKPLATIPQMAEAGLLMLNGALDAYVENSPERAREIAKQDDAVDRFYDQMYGELLTIMIADPSTAARATHLLWVAHNLERIADRVTNICERVIFSATGKFEEVNPKDFGKRAAVLN
jgi:phosphate transport system protein